ncbi:hypothetical protein [Geminicoccus roseus]|uniref:hypothetical protein n=1 Tax=Geminicoccus roseus TaxID=404900 RepID=UPI0003F8B2EE|nr:hypothetical protein [Geminicoccus roseus]
MAYRIDPERDRDFVEEFRRAPTGRHSPGLQRVLNSLRATDAGRPLTVMRSGDAGGWVLVRLPGDRSGPVEVEDGRVFGSLEEAEWHVFCRRWLAATGERIDGDLP